MFIVHCLLNSLYALNFEKVLMKGDKFAHNTTKFIFVLGCFTMKSIRQLFKRYFNLKLFLTVCLGVILVVTLGFGYLKRMPAPDLRAHTKVTFYDRHGDEFLEEVMPKRQSWVSLDEISSYVVNGFLATEDRHFHEHNGFRLRSIARSMLANFRAGESVQGASTITQQYARNIFLSFERTYARKLREVAYAIHLEESYDKDTILEGYLNTISFGHGVYGIQDAAQFYFGKNASELTLNEASLLVGIPKGPSVYSPLDNYENARERQALVLSAMVRDEFITDGQKNDSLAQDLKITGEYPTKTYINYHFIDAVLSELAEAGIDFKNHRHLHVHTTLDRDVQTHVNEAVHQHIDDESDLQNVVIVIEPRSGDVLAISGGSDYGESQFNRALNSYRQVGSIMKPILYVAALEYGFTPSSGFISRPTTFTYGDGRTYTPSNYLNRYSEAPISMANALATSDNIYAVKTHTFLGMDVMPEMATRLGISAEIEEIPSAALGVSNINMMEMAEAYAVFANYGRAVSHRFITVVKENGQTIVNCNISRSDTEQIISATHAIILNEMMTGMFDLAHNNHLGITGLSIIPQLTHRYAGKTGSTDTDSWMIGYTPELVTMVWVGYDDNELLDERDEVLAAKYIWADVMENSLDENATWFKAPSDVISVPVNPISGEPINNNARRCVDLYFEKTNTP